MIFRYETGSDSWTKVAEGPSVGWDPTLFKVDGTYVFAQAPYTSEGGGRQYIIGWSGTTLGTLLSGGTQVDIVEGRYGAGIAILVWGLIIVGSVDNIIRPIVYNRWAKIHPIVTLVGALAGIRYFGILGLLIGPLALSYFFELIQMYREEYIEEEDRAVVDGLVGAIEVGSPSGQHPAIS